MASGRVFLVRVGGVLAALGGALLAEGAAVARVPPSRGAQRGFEVLPRGSQPSPPRRVLARPPLVEGPLSVEMVRRVVLRHLGEVDACYLQHLRSQPSFEGLVRLRFEVDAAGVVRSPLYVPAEGGTAPEAQRALGECLVRAASRWSFPSSGPGATRVEYPLFLLRHEPPAPSSPPGPPREEG